MRQEQSEKHIQNIIAAAWGLVGSGFVLLITGIAATGFTRGGFSLANLSNLGSYLQGTVGSVWALSGLLFIYGSLVGQRKQLAQQDEELEDQRKQFQLQQESLRRQNFETALFQLLALHNSNINGIELPQGTNHYPLKGRAVFMVWHQTLQAFYRGVSTNEKITIEKEKAVHAYVNFYHARQHDLAHYFRTLYHIFKFIRDSSFENKRQYTSLVRAQLSAGELALLFYNCISPFGEKFKPLVEEFGLLEHLDNSLLLNPEHAGFYLSGAYH